MAFAKVGLLLTAIEQTSRDFRWSLAPAAEDDDSQRGQKRSGQSRPPRRVTLDGGCVGSRSGRTFAAGGVSTTDRENPEKLQGKEGKAEAKKQCRHVLDLAAPSGSVCCQYLLVFFLQNRIRDGSVDSLLGIVRAGD